MEASAVVLAQLEEVGGQLERCVEGLSAQNWSYSVNPHAMTAAQMFRHLSECCVAFQKSLSGDEHQWGSYTVDSDDPEEIMKIWKEERKKAVDGLAAADATPEMLMNASHYLVMHDAYHVGQLVTLRLTINPQWDSYSIYG